MNEWIVFSGVGPTGPQGEPGPSGSMGTPAPQLLGATVSVVFSLPGNDTQVSFAGNISLPVNDAHYAELSRIEIYAYPPGEAAVPIASVPSSQFGASTVPYAGGQFPQASADQTGWKLEFRPYNTAGSPSASYFVSGVTVPGARCTAVTARETGTREVLPSDAATRLVSLTVGSVSTLNGGQVPQVVTQLLSEDNGATFSHVGWKRMDFVGQQLTFTRLVPATDQIWKVATIAGAHLAVETQITAANLQTLYPGAVVSDAFTIAGLAAPGANVVTGITAGTITAKSEPSTGWAWAELNGMTWVDPPDPNAWLVKFYVRETDASGSPAPDSKGTWREWFEWEVKVASQTVTYLGVEPLEITYRDNGDTHHYLQIQCVAVNRLSTSPADWAGTNTASSVAQGSIIQLDFGTLPDGAIPANRLDPASMVGLYIDPASQQLIAAGSENPSNNLTNSDFDRVEIGASAVAWQFTGTAYPVAFSVSNSTPPNVCRLAGSAFARQGMFSVHPGDLYYAEAWWLSGGSADGGIGLALDYYDSTGAYVSSDVVTATAASIASTTALTRASLNCTVPAGASRAMFRVNSFNNTTGFFVLDRCILRWRPSTGTGTQPDPTGGVAVKPGAGVEVGSDGGVNVRVGGGTTIDANNTVVVKQSYTIKVDASGSLSLVGLPRVPGLPALPSASYPAGAVVLNTLDGKVYRTLTGAVGTWSCSNDPSDLVAGALASGVTINASQVNAGTFNGFTFLGSTMTLDLNGITTSINNAWDSAKQRYVGVKVSEDVVPATGPLLNFATHFARGYSISAKTYSYSPVTQEVMGLVSMNDDGSQDSYGFFYLGCARNSNSIVMSPIPAFGTTIQIDGQTVLKSRRPAVGQVTGTPSGTYGIVEQNILTNLQLKHNYLMTNVLGRNGHGLTGD